VQGNLSEFLITPSGCETNRYYVINVT